ncbi:1-deoxy-D-xylulose-5-phosphate reductoisomerase [Solitalea lacus]|uniref:1-deoxy-D-xylulose-5-phosphate reductoisomerase n=1 Tax=Solitalea lacus TaxID=2911172 RepID=UPI001EDA3A51|nr:1-deoxy-D-xylulose-5-phosphate reductoisomerase [Solitalea lacus]UKJ06205.1 1-deoxy-D-xylulose-5-phosphate reductoisomerase [Solitalea lacus]
MKRIAILGSSGSIGTQALEVIAANPDKFKAEVLTVNGNADLLIQQALRFSPKAVVVADESKYQYVKNALSTTPILVLAGEAALAEVVQYDSVDMVLTALVGYVGLRPTIAAIKAGKNIALANKETLVVAGDLVTELAKLHQVSILPVDSEHSAIFQCLTGEDHNPIEKIILTASGGPFRGKGLDDLKMVTKHQALKHPNWSMGAKITIDSASLMNKGLEVIEAKWLFNLDINQIEVVIHPQSIIHSMVQFNDGSIKAQMGLPDMKLPIQYAMAYPQRIKSDFPRFSFIDFPKLSFEAPDIRIFRNLALAFEALEIGGNCPCVINAANEVVVDAFLKDKIGFLQMSDIIEECMQKVTKVAKPSYDDYVYTDREARIKALELIS